MKADELMDRRALERLSQMAVRVHGCREAQTVAREVLSTADSLFGTRDMAVYVPSSSEPGVWVRVDARGQPCPERVEPPARFLQALERRREPCPLACLTDEVDESFSQAPLAELLEVFHGGLVAPLGTEDRLEAICCLGFPPGSLPLTAEQDGWLSTMVRQGSAAFSNARLLRELEDLREELDRKVLQLLTLFEVSREIHSFANWDLLTKNILYTAMGNLGIRAGALLAPQRPGEPWSVWHARGMRPESTAGSLRLRPQDPLLEHLAKVRRAVKRSEIERSFPHSEVLKLEFEVLVPGISSQGVEFGLVLGTKLNGRALSADETEYLMILCGQAAVVFQNQELVRQNIERERLAAVGQALAGLSHDFRGILNGFTGASRHLGRLVAQIGEGQAVDAEKVEKWWEVLQSNEKRLTQLIGDVLEYSKPREPVREGCQINDLLRELVQQRQEDFSKRKIRVDLDLAPSLPTVKADTTRLFRALANLLENASDAVSTETGTIELRTRMQFDALTIEVKDNGTGIAPEHLGRLFDPLFTTKKGSKGTGFGLANVKKIIEEHQGSVRVSSKPGAGSTFRIEIPLKEASRRMEAAARQESSGKDT